MQDSSLRFITCTDKLILFSNEGSCKDTPTRRPDRESKSRRERARDERLWRHSQIGAPEASECPPGK
ncbi:unnamed protein product [Spirodela intermedia]|uniref:Uncharacterized protein n=1 Tax=Spirodela intermedia TaxID=51605 RepID=A0A7I8IX33_SPIIN|nr:unnamed protein product [Spirodela intermedia]CAA6662381.1 unnamed protein product [Spirodela intermedia]